MIAPKRLIEVDLPILRISYNAGREKESRRSHVPLLYIWPATRPTSACRAILLAAIVPDPADPDCPAEFRKAAAKLMQRWAATHAYRVSPESSRTLRGLMSSGKVTPETTRAALLDFVAEYSAPSAAAEDSYNALARELVSAAHRSLSGPDAGEPVVLDSFAGGGAIPLEALRIGCEVIAGELNPVAVLYEKVLLEYLPRYGDQLVIAAAEAVANATQRVRENLQSFYPDYRNGSRPIAYLWARTILSEEPTQEPPVEVPLLRSLWLAKGRTPTALRWVLDPQGRVECDQTEVRFADGRTRVVRRPRLEVFHPRVPREVPSGTIRGVAATCPVTGYVTTAASVRKQLRTRRGGGEDSRLFAVVTTIPGRKGRIYRVSDDADERHAGAAAIELSARAGERIGGLPPVPDEAIPETTPGLIHPPTFGATAMADLYSPRQRLFLTSMVRAIRETGAGIDHDPGFSLAVATVGALFVNRLADLNAALCVWQLSTPNAAHVFGRWGLPMVWDYAEVNPLADAGGSPASVWSRMEAGMRDVVRSDLHPASVIPGDARALPVPDDSIDTFFTDPPYYNAVPYADLSDYFYVWMRRVLAGSHPDLLAADLTPKASELCEMAGWDQVRYPEKDKSFFENGMQAALTEGRRVLKPNGVAIVVFAHKSTAGWEALLGGLIGAGWTITASWPVDTEMASRMQAKGAAALASSVHLVCRPREDVNGNLVNSVGEWRDVLSELGPRIHEWMPRLSREGVVGADAIFACLGPALEIFSRYERVEKASGELVSLRDYLEHVWAAVAREAMSLVFTDPAAANLEEDARVTAMWLWTLRSASGTDTADAKEVADEADTPRTGGFGLEYDAARKIAQGLGASLEALPTLVEIKGDTARLIGIRERARYLLESHSSGEPAAARHRDQLRLFTDNAPEEERDPFGTVELRRRTTVLDQLHQAMILFGSGRAAALQVFLSEGAGAESRFWSLAQSLSALYPPTSDEKRWVDGVLARKKNFGY
jgi:putative DNA methylase